MFDIVVVSEIGERNYMEDTYFLDVISDTEVFCGIYDGHGGKFASEYARNNLHKIFFQELGNRKQQEEEFFKTAFNKLSDGLKNQESGCTAVAFYIRNNDLFYANAGDARLIVIGNYGVRQLTKDHRVNNPEEQQRIISQGGIIVPPYVYKGEIGLMPTRTLGDEYFKDIGIISTPEAGNYYLSNNDQWLLAGTDGIFDEITNIEIEDLINKCENAKEAADILKKEILINRAGTDNLTIVVIKIYCRG